jgi:hypothetical protein
LGVYFGNNKAECEKLNWENKIGLEATISTDKTNNKADKGYP